LTRHSLFLAANRFLRRFDLEIVRRSDADRPLALLGRQPVAPEQRSASRAPPYCRVFGADALADAGTFDFSVVIPAILRSTLPRAVRSIFAQDLPGRVQTLIGVDVPLNEFGPIEAACQEHPSNHTVMLFYPGYSTSVRHGGLHPAWDGGALRTILSYLAVSRRVAYLDGDNWWAPDHLSSLSAALEGHDWAWSRRLFVHPRSSEPICEDIWESIGPVREGTFARLGGWVDPNCLAIDKLACEAALRWWSIPLRNSRTAMDADRNVFRVLSEGFRGRGTGTASVFYTVNERDPEQPGRVAAIGEARYRAAGERVRPTAEARAMALAPDT